MLPGLRRRPQIEVGIEDDLSVEERPRSSQEEESFLEGEFGKNNIPIAIPLFSDEIFKKIPKEPSSDKKDISVKFGQFDVIIPGRIQENKIEDNIIKDYNDDFPVEYQYDYSSDEDLIANYDIARVFVKATSTEVPYEVTGKVESSNSLSSGEDSTSDGRTTKPEVTVTPEAAATSTSEKLASFVPAVTTTRVPAKEQLTANKLDTNEKVDSVKLGEKKKSTSIGGVAATVVGGEKGPQIASTETPRVAKDGTDETAEQEVEKKGVADEESTSMEAKNDPNATNDSNTIVENVEEVLPKSLTRGQLTVATTEKSETSESQTESPAPKTTAPFSRFKPTVSAATNRAVSEIDEKSSVTIPSVFRFLPTLSSGRRDRPSLRERAKALRAITTLSQALRTSTQSSSETSSTAISLSHQKKSTPSPEVPISPTPLNQPPVQLKATKTRVEPDKSNEADEQRRDTQERGLKGDASASVVGEPLLRDPIGAVWETGQADANQLSSKPNAATSGENNDEQLSKAQLQEKLRLLQEKLAKLATDAEVLTKRPTQSTESTTTQSTTIQSSSSLVTGPIRVVKVTTPPPTTLSSQPQPTRAPTTQLKATTLPGQEETKFPNFPTSDVQDELRAAVEAGLRNLGSFVIWSDSPRVVPPPTRPSPVFRPSRRVAKVN